ncbi:MAG TPA: DnaJ domain-containing protein [Myxococcaceae bacterium]|nr:DnaJ domain-containing protein [Myxococcaceae bacterium]
MLRENESPGNDAEAALGEAVDLPEDRKREILAREAALSGDHYAVLGLRPGATIEQIRAAYFEASRVFHPDRYYGKKLGSFQGRLERIFKRLAEAHGTLTDEEKRAEYLQAHPRLRVAAAAAAAAAAPARAPTAAEDAARQAERRSRLARHPYLARGAQAKKLVEEARAQLRSGAPERALGLLHKAAKLDPRHQAAAGIRDVAESQKNAERAAAELDLARQAVVIGDMAAAAARFRAALSLDPTSHALAREGAEALLRAGEPALARALAQKAVELQPEHVPSLMLLAHVCHALGMDKVARRHAEAVLEHEPEHAEAKALLKKVRRG